MAFEYWISVLIFAVIVWYLCEPLFNKSVVMADKAEDINEKITEDLMMRKEEVLLTLKDIEFDYKTKKMSEADYHVLFNDALQQGADLVKKIGDVAEAGKQAAIEAAKPVEVVTATPKPKSATAKFCTNCGSPLVAGAKFCGDCGQKTVV